MAISSAPSDSTVFPLLPLQDVVVFPHMILPLYISSSKGQAAIKAALDAERLLFVSALKPPENETDNENVYEIGTVVQIMRSFNITDGRQKIMVQGLRKGRIAEQTGDMPYRTVRIEYLPETEPRSLTEEEQALVKVIQTLVEELPSLGRKLPPEITSVLKNVQEPGALSDLIANGSGLPPESLQKLLEIVDPLERLRELHIILVAEIEKLRLQKRIQDQAQEEMNRHQRDYFIREQMRALQAELGEKNSKNEDIENFRTQIQEAGMPEKVQAEAEKQLRRMEMMHAETAEYSIVYTYLDWLVSLPWNRSTEDNLDLKKAAKVLNEDHYGLDKIKERILEFLAVRKLTKEPKGPVLCFIGPPGVGKTSLGKSIARALDRKFFRVSLGGIHDEAEIRGHRRTYLGALPGRIIQGIKQCGTNNPVFMLDEIDKLTKDFRGDPSAALLELLDPEQNNAFSDHYINLPFDFSKVLFIVTANLADPIPSALQDRLEIIRLSGYTSEEKTAIARRFLIPRQLEANGLEKNSLHFSEATIGKLISAYTAEAGLRNLEREIGRICRKVARRIAEERKAPKVISPESLKKFLGPPRFQPEEERRNDEVGVCTGLAWTRVGGDVLYIEVEIMEGKGQINLTGHLGDVMKESAQTAFSYVRAHAEELHIDPELFTQKDVHVHVPAGAIPKDGPSAGITIASAIASAFTGRKARGDMAMTGEISLRGKVLPIGGLKEKLLAAVRAKITTVLIPRKNHKDLAELPANLTKKLILREVETVDEVFAQILLEEEKK
ncbi:MAG: endopeptidase La [Deltaproteobacteria bacterium]|nr:endopeptidase La [Deltaproteobacteria bacterium]